MPTTGPLVAERIHVYENTRFAAPEFFDDEEHARSGPKRKVVRVSDTQRFDTENYVNEREVPSL